MLVYRIEKNEIGPFSSDERSHLLGMKLKALCQSDFYCDHLPGPNRHEVFSEHFIPFFHKFGCPSAKTLHYWFGDVFEDLIRDGFSVSVYKVETYWNDEYQVMYSVHTAEFVCNFHIFELEKVDKLGS